MEASIEAGTLRAASTAGRVRVFARSVLDRRTGRLALWLGLAAGVGYVLVPQAGALRESLESLPGLDARWLVAGIGLAGLRYAASAASLQAATPRPLQFGPTILVQLASSFVGRLTPEGVGWLVLNQRYLERVGLPRSSAISAITLKLVVGALARLVIAVGVVVAAGGASDASLVVSISPSLVAVGIVGVGIVAVAARGLRRRVIPRLRAAIAPAATDLRALAGQPRRAFTLATTTGMLTILPGLTLAACLAAFDVDVPISHVFAVYLGGTALAAVSPTPGNLGALELTLSAGLGSTGAPAGAAIGAVLVYRLLTFWLPILPGFIAFRILQRRGLL